MTRTRRVAALTVLVALALPATSLAGEWDRDRRERRGAHRDRRALHDDLRDAQLAQQLLQEFERTWAALDRNGVRAVELRAQAALEDEAREAAFQIDQAARELDRDRWAARRERWDRWARPHRERGVELADDRQDLIQATQYRDRIEAIRAEWAGLRDQRVYPAMVRKHALLEDLVRLAHMEIQGDQQELRDDEYR